MSEERLLAAMSVLADLLGLAFLMLVAYRGFSVILFAPLAAMLPLLLTHPSQIPQVFTSLYMERAVFFIKLYFPLFLLGAVFGKLIELSGFAASLTAGLMRFVGPSRTVLALVLTCAVLTYGGVSLFVVIFAVYPFAAEMFRRADLPKRLIPACVTLGALSFTMDAVPGTPQIQNIIPTSFFGTTAWAAPVLGCVGSLFILGGGLLYLRWQVRRAGHEGYGRDRGEATTLGGARACPPLWQAAIPLLTVPVANAVLTRWIPRNVPAILNLPLPGLSAPLVTSTSAVTSIWALEGALLLAIGFILLLAFRSLAPVAMEGTKSAVNGALLATLNTGSEYGFGAVIAALPGFVAVRNALGAIPNPLLNAAVTTTTLAGLTGSASGGLSIALGAMSGRFIALAHASRIPLPVMHRVTAMASGGMDALPHNGAIITLLAVTGLSHKEAYGGIFAITLVKTAAVFVVIVLYTLTGVS